MATEVLQRRGTTAEHATFTGGAGELTIDTTKNTAIVHDGSTAGGIELINKPYLAAIDTDMIPDMTGGSNGVSTHSLGSPTAMWQDVYIGPGSLYVDGQKVLESNSGTITVSADSDQNIQVKSQGAGDIEFYPSGTGVIQMKGTLQIQAGDNLTSSDSNAISIAVDLDMNGEMITNLGTPSAASDVATKGYVDDNYLPSTGGVLSGGLTATGLLVKSSNHAVIRTETDVAGYVSALALDDNTTDTVWQIENANSKGNVMTVMQYASSTWTERMRIGTNGVISTGDTVNYETLITSDDDIPNKKYVDSQVSRKNYIINGNFSVWQRGSSFSGYGYTADRWRANAGDNAPTHSITVSRHSVAPGDNNWRDGEEGFILRYQCTGAGGNITRGAQLWQFIESVKTLNGKTTTASFSIQNNGGSAFNMNVRLQQVFGTGGSPSVEIGETTLSIAPGRSDQTVTFTVPSITGKTVATDGTDSLLLVFALDPNANADFYISGVQLEEGDSASTFESRPLAEELIYCQRFYEKSYNQGVFAGTLTAAGAVTIGRASGVNQCLGPLRFITTKRIQPTLTVYSTATGTAGQIYDVDAAADQTASIIDLGESGAVVYHPTTANRWSRFHYVADAEY